MRFADRRVLITGGASGIGAVLAARFADEGARIAVCDADPEAMAGFSGKHPKAITAVADVSDETAMAGFLTLVDQAWDGVDVVIANAGSGGPAGAIETISYDEWTACLAVNLGGAFLTSRWAAGHMRRAGQGVILLMSSTAGLFAYPGRAPYAVAKAGIVTLMTSLASDLGPDGVRVNAIAPGAVTGVRMDRVVAMEAAAHDVSQDDIRRRYVDGVAMKTWVTSDDVAEMALFLASDAAARISGQVIAVDGHTETIT